MKRQRTNGFQPSLEALECRFMPAAISGNALVITGGNAHDNVVVTENHITNKIKVTQNGVTQKFRSVGITAIYADLGRGNNTFRYQLGGGSDFTDAKLMVVTLGPPNLLWGAGTNRATFDLLNDGKGGQAEVLNGLSITVNGSSGYDQVDALFGSVDNAEVNLSTRLSYGDDRVLVELQKLRNGADVSLDLQDTHDLVHNGRVLLGGGNDRMNVDAQGDIDAGSSLSMTMNGFSGSDRLHARAWLKLDGALFLRMNGGAGIDAVMGDLDFSSGSSGSLDAILHGDASPDDYVGLFSNHRSPDVDLTIINEQVLQN